MTDRQFEILRWLDDEKYVRPMDLGGRDASHHSETLRRLVKLGLAETKRQHPPGDRSGRRYRRTPAGMAAVYARIGQGQVAE